MRSLETRRKLFHLALGIAIVALLYWKILSKTTLFVVLLLGILLSFLSKKSKIPIIHHFLLFFERPTELKEFPGKGAIFYIGGMLLALILFPEDIAFAAIAVVALGDATSTIFGRRFGKIQTPFSTNKTLIGTLSGLVAAFIGTILFLHPVEGFVCSTIGMLVESTDYQLIDDNLTVPLAAGISVVLLRLFLG